MVWAQSCGKTNHYPNPLTGGEGFIPAHAGKTSSFSWLLRRSAAHPRSRGENTCGEAVTAVSVGSSPLRRGKHVGGALQARPPRLIPAHAGKTRISVTRRRRIRAHPHSRGENQIHRVTSAILTGSSPLTRGKHEENGVSGHRRGLIPTHAGKTSSFSLLRVAARLIPTHTRKTTCMPKRQSALRDHPHSRGENQIASPLLPHGVGLIPTHAGNTVRRRHTLRSRRAHPRSRGENEEQLFEYLDTAGSSPLTRGKHCPQAPGRQLHGLIPTHAGKTPPSSPVVAA